MALDFHIAVSPKTFQREKGSLRYFADPLSGFGGIRPPDQPDVATTNREKTAKEQPEKQRKANVQQQQERAQAQQAQNLSQMPHAELPSETREGRAQEHAEGQALKDAAKQGFKELQHSEFNQSQPQQIRTGSAFRAPSTTGGSVLQNIRALTGDAHPEKSPLAAQGEGFTPQARDTGGRPSATGAEMRGVRLADITRQTGIQEHAHLPTPRSPGGPGTTRLPMGRTILPHSQPFRPDTPFARLSDRSLPRSFNPDNLTTLLNQAAKTLPDSHAALNNRTANVAVVLHGSLVFVRDGDKVRTFRLLSDGTLHETTEDGEHAEGGPPLSGEARSELSRLLKQKGIHARLHGEKESIGETREEAKLGQQMKDRSLAARGELRSLTRDDSSFAQLLKGVLEEGSQVGEYLAEGEDAQFAEKSDWQGFFGRMLGLGSEEKPTQKTFDEIMGFIFRGLFKKKEGKGETLVSDIKYEFSGKSKEMRFARIDVMSEELAEILKNLKPGQTISKETLKKFFGDELSFTELIHVIQKTDPILASEIMKSIKFDPHASVDPFSQARLEHHIFSRSRRPAAAPAFGGNGSETAPGNGGPVFASVYDLQQKEKREVSGKPKLYTFIAYTAIVFGVLLLLFFLLGK